ncbi:MAG: helical backbone metal receptor [Saprospiraceae bacterium]|nr:helical backbone metal receptor [Saprospiraceae bacterium]
MLFYDQLQRSVHLPQWPPRRIISLVPSQTELLYDLGLEQEVVGITKFCVHPPAWFQQKTRIGGTKTLDLQKIAALQPDLIIGNKEENDQAQIEALAGQYPVWLSDVSTLEDALEMILRIGSLTNRAAMARQLATDIRQAFEGLEVQQPLRRVAYFIWRKPYLVAADATFIHSMLVRAGFENVFAHRSRYPEITLSELAEAQPEVILLSSEPYPFAEKHFAALREVCPAARIQLLDGEMFSWYGSRLWQAPAYFQALKVAN